MNKLSQFKQTKKIKYVFCDIDDTLTNQGQLGPEAYAALWQLHKNSLQVIPVTGRPAGWCEMIARFWPVRGVIGENGAFYFTYKENKMHRFFVYDEQKRSEYTNKLKTIQREVLEKVPGAAVASDQFCRLFDLAIDFKEDVTELEPSDINKIVDIFKSHGAQAKVSSIHVNGWFGDHNKLSTCRQFIQNELHCDFDAIQDEICFIGDSPNDEPLFAQFKNSFAVANIKAFAKSLKHQPQYVTDLEGGHGFVQFVEQLLL